MPFTYGSPISSGYRPASHQCVYAPNRRVRSWKSRSARRNSVFQKDFQFTSEKCCTDTDDTANSVSYIASLQDLSKSIKM